MASFFAAAVLLALAPGPDNLFVLAQSALHGPRAGLLVTLGLCTGLLGHTLAVMLGVAAAVQASPTAFTAIQLVGAAYLLWLAWQAFQTRPATLGDAAPAPLGPARLYGRGVIMNLSNPKVTLFFLALLPQFTRGDGGPLWQQLGALGLLFIAATLMVFGAVALLGGQLQRWLARRPEAQRWLHRAAGLLFVGLAAHLLAGNLF